MRRFAAIGSHEDISLPERATPGSAGYDLAAAADCTIAPGAIGLVPTGLKVYLEPGEFLLIAARSSLALRRSLMLANGVGVIDADYADNPENEGHIQVALWNAGAHAQHIPKGERVAQAIFFSYLTVDSDQPGGRRTGGFGSTGRL